MPLICHFLAVLSASKNSLGGGARVKEELPNLTGSATLVIYNSRFMYLNQRYGIYLNGRSILVDVERTERR